MVNQDDIVKKILRKHKEFKAYYYEDLDILTGGHVETAQFSTRLSCLSGSIANAISDNNLKPQTLIDVLDDIEEYALYLENEESKKELEIMFFETIVNTMSHITKDDERYRHVRLFKTNLGPASEELCEQNHAFWIKVIKSKNESIQRHYDELELDYFNKKLSIE